MYFVASSHIALLCVVIMNAWEIMFGKRLERPDTAVVAGKDDEPAYVS